MRIAKILVAGGFLVMLGSILYGVTQGDFSGEGGILLDLVWGQVTLIDIYTSFLLIWGWMVFREASWWRAGVLLVLMVTLGSLTATGYAFWAMQTSGGDWRRFWLGRRANG
jgi:hypothetical protein